MNRCTSLKRDGSPCTLPAIGGNGFCWAHDPAYSKQRKERASKAGKSGKPSVELNQIKRKLRGLADDVLAGKIDTSRGSVASQVYGVLLRVYEAERKEREQREILERLEALEQPSEPQCRAS